MKSRWGLALCLVLLVAAGCGSPDARASRALADELKIDGYRRVSDSAKGNTSVIYFVGPAGVDLAKAVSVTGWSSRPELEDISPKAPFEWIITGKARSGERECTTLIMKLRRGEEQLALGATSQELQGLKASRLDFVRVAFVCGEA